VTFGCAKIGHVLMPGAACCGDLEIADISIPNYIHKQIVPDMFYVDPFHARTLLKPRPQNGHKGTFGHALIVAGSTGKTGASVLAGNAALRAGAGLVTVACPASLHSILEIKLTEVMTAPLADSEGALVESALPVVHQLLEDKQVLAVGPGLGTAEETCRLVQQLLCEAGQPVVLDADGLNALARATDILEQRRGRVTILTPHPGEMARLTGMTTGQIEADRVGCARRFAQQHKVILVLKGTQTLTALPDGRIYVNSTGNAALASGGSGDVLTGMIAAFLAQGYPAENAAVLAVYLHGHTADLWSETRGTAGLAASDLLSQLPEAHFDLWQELD